MSLRFENPAGFERTCLAAAGSGAAAAVLAGWTGHAGVLLLWAAAAALAVAALLAVRAQHELPPTACIVTAIALAAAAGLSARGIPALAELLATLLPRDATAAASGAVLGLWLGSASAPLHLRGAADPVEARLAKLRPRLEPELLRLSERAVAARAGLLRSAPAELEPELRRVADEIALSALDLAVDRTRGTREDLLERVTWLERASSALAPPEGGAASSPRGVNVAHPPRDRLERVR